MPTAAFQTGPSRAQTNSAVFMSLQTFSGETHEDSGEDGHSCAEDGAFVHPEDVPGDYRAAVAMSLHAELGSTHRAIKSALRWTGASERTVKCWFAGERGPSGEHLMSLARHSDAVLVLLLTMADRLVLEDDDG